jgi:drug/metabolite transporter (DMT)-like permease
MSPTLVGISWAASSALCLGVGTFLYKISTRSLGASDTTFFYYCFSVALATVVWLFSAERSASLDKSQLVWPFLMAFFLCASVWTFSSAVQLIDISVASTVRGLSFVPAVVLGVVVYGERLTPRTVAAIVLVVAAVFLLGIDASEKS